MTQARIDFLLSVFAVCLKYHFYKIGVHLWAGALLSCLQTSNGENIRPDGSSQHVGVQPWAALKTC